MCWFCHATNRRNISDLHPMELYDIIKGKSVLHGGLQGTCKCCPPVDWSAQCLLRKNICLTAYWHSHPHDGKRHPWLNTLKGAKTEYGSSNSLYVALTWSTTSQQKTPACICWSNCTGLKICKSDWTDRLILKDFLLAGVSASSSSS